MSRLHENTLCTRPQDRAVTPTVVPVYTTVTTMLWPAMALIPVLLMYLLLLLIALYCWFRWSHRELIRVAADLPLTHKTWPILGHSYAALGGMEALSKFVLEMTKTAVEKRFKNACFWCGPLPFIAVHDIQDIQARQIRKRLTEQVEIVSGTPTTRIISIAPPPVGPWQVIICPGYQGFCQYLTILNSSNTIDKADEYEYFKCGFNSEAGSLSYNLVTAPGKIWRVTRKHMSPLFHPQNLQHMLPVFNQNSRELVSRLSKHVGHGPVNLMPFTMDIALKTVCNLVFGPGVDIDLNSPDFQGLMSVVESIPEIFMARLLQPWLRIDMVFRFFYRNELKKLNLFWNNFTNSRVERAKEISKQKNFQKASLDDDNTTVTEPLNILDAFSTLQKTHPEFTGADMPYEMLSFYCTGTDTLGSAVASCLLALAQFTDIQERLYQEVSSVVGADDDVELQDLNRMPYLDQVVKETLRWFTTVPYTLRKATNDLQLSTCTIPAGNTIVVSLAGIHMDPKIYPDPLLFDPDRFSHKNSAGKERSTFIPFSGGPRNCIAKTYAMQLMKIMIVHVLRKFKLKTDMDIYKLRKKLVITLVSVDGYNVLLEQRC